MRSPEWCLTNSINKVALTALLAKYERGITGTASPSARCLHGFAGEKGWQRPVCSGRLTPPNSSQPLALWVIYSIYFIAPIIPRTSLAQECACVGATALSIIPNGKSLSPGAWRDGNNGKGTLGWMGPPRAFVSAVCRSQRAWLAGPTLRDGVSKGLAQNPTSMAQFAPAEACGVQGQLCHGSQAELCPQGWAVPL